MPAVAPQPPVSGESFGPRLRQERERRQIRLQSIADKSKISVSLFEDLERDDASRWPSGIYRRAFIRAYAQAVGLDADATAREFLERFPDPNDPDLALAPPPAPSSSAFRVPAAAAFRVTVDDTTPATAFVGGRILPSARDRWAAVGCDAAVTMTLGLVLYAVLGTLWMPLCLTLVGYYGGGILLLGNTPGVCLSAPGRNTKRPTGGSPWSRKIRSYAAWIVPALGQKDHHPAGAAVE
jgi:transcriptional regulator with XRE-family HTH domain